MSALALVCGVSVACSSNTSANVNTNSANTNIAQENTSSQNNINNNNTNAKITSDKAKEIALNHANLSENQVTFIKSNIDYDDGMKAYDVEFYHNNQVSYINAHSDYDDGIQVYDVSLYVNDVEYSYEINAQNGNIVSYEMDSIYD